MLDTNRTVTISADGLYRYSLTVRWSAGPRMGFIMLNPSTADAMKDDPTSRRCIAFARREGCGSLIIENLYPYRATKPADLWAQPAPVRIGSFAGEIAIHKLMLDNDGPVVAAWGAVTKGAEVGYVARFGHLLKCLGKTANGQPRHPLYVRGDQPLIPLK